MTPTIIYAITVALSVALGVLVGVTVNYATLSSAYSKGQTDTIKALIEMGLVNEAALKKEAKK